MGFTAWRNCVFKVGCQDFSRTTQPIFAFFVKTSAKNTIFTSFVFFPSSYLVNGLNSNPSFLFYFWWSCQKFCCQRGRIIFPRNCRKWRRNDPTHLTPLSLWSDPIETARFLGLPLDDLDDNESGIYHPNGD